MALKTGGGYLKSIKSLNLVAGAGSVAYLIESMHGAGPPTAQRTMIGRQGNVEGKVEKVKRLLGI